MLTNNLIQIAGIIDVAEAEMLCSCGVRYLGFPLRLPVNHVDLTEAAAAAIIRRLTPPDFGILITYLDNAVGIVDFCNSLGARIVQLHGDIEIDELKKLRKMLPGLTVIKSLAVGLHSEEALESSVAELSAFVHAYITDTFDPVTGASGATGKTHDWGISRRLVELSDRPVILAGGLTPDNVRHAILEVQPAGVDVHTGVEEASGRKSREKIAKFVAEAEAGFRQIQEQKRSIRHSV